MGIRRLLKALFASIGRVVVESVKLASGAVIMVMRMLQPAPPALDYNDAIVDDAAGHLDDVRARDAEVEILRTGGELIRRAASQRIRDGQVTDATIPIGIRNWVNLLPRDELAVIVASTAEDVGRHVAGQIILRDMNGIAIGRPDAAKDAAEVERRRVDRERRERDYGAAVGRRRRPELVPTPILGW